MKNIIMISKINRIIYIISIMHIYSQNNTFLYRNIKLRIMISMYLKYDNKHTNRIFNALICINNHVNSCKNYMLSPHCKSFMSLAWIKD